MVDSNQRKHLERPEIVVRHNCTTINTEVKATNREPT